MLEYLMFFEYEEQYGPIQMEKVALFNANHITTEEATRIIRLGEYNHNLIIMSKDQWSKSSKTAKANCSNAVLVKGE